MNQLLEQLLPSDSYIYGTADMHGLIDPKYGNFQYAISFGKRLNDDIVNAITQGPTMEYYNHYHQINDDLRNKSKEIKAALNEINIHSIIIDPSDTKKDENSEEYLKTLAADVSHKMAATRAGLGWIGKTDLFISKRFGPRLRLNTILIDQKPEVESTPIEASQCGKCKVCVDNCPANAASGELWNISLHRDDFFNAFECRKTCARLAKEKLNKDIRICGICVSVCPNGKKRSNKS